MPSIFSTTQKVEGISLYYENGQLNVEEYHGKHKHYFCGKELLRFDQERAKLYTILVIDYDECCCADIYTDGEIVTRFSEHSEVPHKHKKGGQSAARFSRIRENEITKWFKRIDQYLKRIDTEIYLGISPIYQRRFLKTLSTYNKEKFKEVRKTEYANISGIYQYLNKLENAKNKSGGH